MNEPATFYAHDGMDKTEIECDGSVSLVTPGGARFEMRYDKSDGTVHIRSDEQIAVQPVVSNDIEIKTGRRQ